MTDLSNSDAELAYKYMPAGIRGDLEHDAYAEVIDAWKEDRPDDFEHLEAAHDDDTSPFGWNNIELTFERSQVDGTDELTPHTMTGDAEDEVHELAREFAWDYVAAVREAVREYQQTTNFSPREFVAYVLAQSELTYEEAAREMDVSEGTYASKMSREVEAEIESAQATLSFVERFDDGE